MEPNSNQSLTPKPGPHILSPSKPINSGVHISLRSVDGLQSIQNPPCHCILVPTINANFQGQDPELLFIEISKAAIKKKKKRKKVRTSLKTTVNCTIQKGMSSTVYSAKTKDSEKLKILNPVTELNILQRVSIQLLRRKLS